MSDLYSYRENCRGCLSTNLNIAVHLQALPVSSPNVRASAKITETAGADMWQCADCGMVQLKTKIDAVFQYREFQYSTGISVGLREHFERLIAGLAQNGEIAEGKFVLDIGSNDGSLLRYAKNQGCRVLGIDPAKAVAEKANKSGIPTIADFFDRKNAQMILKYHGAADIIISNNTVANIDDLDTLFNDMTSILKEDGLIVIETQYVLDVLQKFLLDVVYHEHINYFAVRPFMVFLERHGLMLVDAQEISPKGGSIRFLIQKVGGPRAPKTSLQALVNKEEQAGLYASDAFQQFDQRVKSIAEDLKKTLLQQREKYDRAVVWGASVGCAALINYFGLADYIDAIFDDTPLNNYIIADRKYIPVLTGNQIRNEMPSEVLVFAWRYAGVIAEKYDDYVSVGGRFTPVLDGQVWV